MQEKKILEQRLIYIQDNYSNNTILYDDSWQLVKEDNNDRKIRYITKDDQVGAFFTDDKAIYFSLRMIQFIILKK